MAFRAPRVHDRNILDALDSIDVGPFQGEVWRIVRQGRDPTKGSTAHGRWSPSGEFEVLYTSLEREGAIAEIGHRLSLEPVWPSKLVHEIHKLSVVVNRAARLTSLETLQRFNVNVSRYRDYEYSATQEIAAAAQFLGHDALMVPNARHSGLNLVVLVENLDPDDGIESISSEVVDWSAWRQR